MFKILTKLFIKSNDLNDPKVRTKYGLMSGVVGIISNLFISVIKIIGGIVTGSIAIIADGINNIADCSSSVITFIAFKLSAIPPDKEHPFGHKRLEYISGVIVAVIIIFVGMILAKSSLEKILNPISLDYSSFLMIIIILLISILIKVWMYFFYQKVGKTIDSNSILVTSKDSFNDILTTLVVLISLIVGKYTGFLIDGYFGMAVAIYIMISGIKLVKETISPLIGEAPTDEFVTKIANKILSYEGVLGYHDLVIHNYGHNKTFVTIHVEVDAAENVSVTHDIIDNIELDFLKDNINIVIHMDPVDYSDSFTLDLKDKVTAIISEYNHELSFHDFRTIRGKTHTNVIFDLVIPNDFNIEEHEIEKYLVNEINKIDKTLNIIIIFDYNYIG